MQSEQTQAVCSNVQSRVNSSSHLHLWNNLKMAELLKCSFLAGWLLHGWKIRSLGDEMLTTVDATVAAKYAVTCCAGISTT